MEAKANLRYVLLLFPTAIVLLDLLFFYLDDVLDEGRSFLYLDTYSQGFFTWWLDIERFWGNFEAWTVGVGVYMGFFTAFAFGAHPGAAGASKASLLRWPLALLSALLAFALVAGLGNWLAPAPYSVGEILVMGWYPAYFPSNVLFLLVAFSGAWLIPPATSKLRRGRVVMPLSPGMASALLAVSCITLHLALVSTWDVASVNNLQKPVTGLIGLLFVTTPLFAFAVASTEGRLGSHSLDNREGGLGLDRRRKAHAWIIVAATLALVGIILGTLALTGGIDTGIDIKADIIPRNFMTWVTTALVATATFFTIQGGRWR